MLIVSILYCIHISGQNEDVHCAAIDPEVLQAYAIKAGFSKEEFQQKVYSQDKTRKSYDGFRGLECTETIVGIRIHFYDNAVFESGFVDMEKFKESVLNTCFSTFNELVEVENLPFDGFVVTGWFNYENDGYLENCDYTTFLGDALLGNNEPFKTAQATKNLYDSVIDLWITKDACTFGSNNPAGAAVVRKDGLESNNIHICIEVQNIGKNERIFCHELGHTTGGQHSLEDGNLGGNSDGYAWTNGKDTFTFMNSFIATVPLYSNKSKGYGSEVQNVIRSLTEDLTEIWPSLYDLTTLCIGPEINVCYGDTVYLDGASNNADSVIVSLVEGDIEILDTASLNAGIIGKVDGVIMVKANNSSDNKAYFRQKSVKINVMYEQKDTTFKINTDQEIELPDGKILSGENVGESGFYFVKNDNANECPTKVNWYLEFSTSTTINDPEKIFIFPNPFTNQINIKSRQDVSSLIIMDSFGRPVKFKLFNNSIYVSNIMAGVYYLKVQDNTGNVHIEKVVKLDR